MGDISSFHMDNFVQVFQSLSETITTSSITRNETFPFVVVPNFEVLAHNARVLSGTELIAFTPLVSDADKYKWYQFSSENQGWVKESRDYLIQNNADLEKTFIDGRIVPVIYQRDAATGEIIEAPGPGPYTPTWYMSPPPFNQGLVVNYNMLAEQFLDDMLPSVALAKEGLMSSVNLAVAKLGGTAISDQAHEAFHFQYVEGLTGESLYEHPHSVYVQPVYNTLDKGTSEIVGMVLVTVPWDRYLANLLPVGVNGIFAVLENSCGQSYTYVIRGNKVSIWLLLVMRRDSTEYVYSPVLSTLLLNLLKPRPHTSEKVTGMKPNTMTRKSPSPLQSFNVPRLVKSGDIASILSPCILRTNSAGTLSHLFPCGLLPVSR